MGCQMLKLLFIKQCQRFLTTLLGNIEVVTKVQTIAEEAGTNFLNLNKFFICFEAVSVDGHRGSGRDKLPLFSVAALVEAH